MNNITNCFNKMNITENTHEHGNANTHENLNLVYSKLWDTLKCLQQIELYITAKVEDKKLNLTYPICQIQEVLFKLKPNEKLPSIYAADYTEDDELIIE